MRRRTVTLGIASACGAALGVGSARGQGSGARRPRRVGFLLLRNDPAPTTPTGDRPNGQQMRARGWIEGENLVTEYAFADYRRERLPALAKQLLDNGAEVLWALGQEAALAAARATASVPIVFHDVLFPVEQGLVESFARPGRNVTGTSQFTGLEVAEKRIELTRELVPGARRMGWLLGPGLSLETLVGGRYDVAAALQATASKFGFETRFFDVRSLEDIDAGLAALRDAGIQILQAGSLFLSARRQAIADFCLRHRLPCATAIPQVVQVTGMLLGYGPPQAEFDALSSRSIDMVDRILRGAKPAQIPVERPRAFELVLNLKTASALGLVIPPALRLRANVLIE